MAAIKPPRNKRPHNGFRKIKRTLLSSLGQLWGVFGFAVVWLGGGFDPHGSPRAFRRHDSALYCAVTGTAVREVFCDFDGCS